MSWFANTGEGLYNAELKGLDAIRMKLDDLEERSTYEG